MENEIEELKAKKLETQKKAVEQINQIMVDNDLEARIDHVIRFTAK